MSAKPDMQVMLCTVHNRRWSFERGEEPEYVPCPHCAREDIEKLRAELATLRAQRNSLLAAIELKRTVEVLG